MTGRLPSRIGQLLLIAGFAAYCRGQSHSQRFRSRCRDSAGGVVRGADVWRPGRGFLLAPAFFIALPAIMFSHWASLIQPPTAAAFVNHAALLAAGPFESVEVLAELARPAAADARRN